MTVIGLTGSSGSGKSSVAALFTRQGFTVLDCDQFARAVLRPDTPCLADIFATFGQTVKNGDGGLNRAALAQIVFADPKELAKLNRIMYPQIITDLQQRLAQLQASGTDCVILDAPTLFESGADGLCDQVIAVIADPKLQIERIAARDHLTIQQATQRLLSQQSNDFYRTRSNHLIENTGSPAELEQQVLQLTQTLKKEKL